VLGSPGFIHDTRAIFFPFDLFGSPGTRAGPELLADAVRDMLDDNKRERIATRARAYAGKVRCEEFYFEKLADYQDWRDQARARLRQVFSRTTFCSGSPAITSVHCPYTMRFRATR